MPSLDDARHLLAERFGFADFREGQAEVIDRLLAGHSTLAIFPTGGGKSICYQLPALMLDGVTLVVSPLIALMKDQIDFLQRQGVAAARLDSTIGAEEARQAFQQLRDGTLKLLYVAPERLGNERFLASLGKAHIALLAVDEAHCISEWGHNFRPDYLKLARLAKQLNVGRVLALTATAPPAVASQIAAAFDIAAADIVRTGFYRSNLSLRISPTTAADRDALLLDRIGERPAGPTIVYVTLQRTAEHVAKTLADAGYPAEAYHAGLDAEHRAAVQDRFMQSDHAIVVATIAFGMGIDKRDIRYVFHYNLPKSLENYAQEVGRAGRDGQAAVCEMLACVDDRVPLENFTYGDTPTREAVDGLVREIVGLPREFDVAVHDLSGRHDIRPLVVETLLTYLQLADVIESVGAFYDTYRYQFITSPDAILETFDARRVDFLRRLFEQSKLGKTWHTIDLTAAAERLKEPRDRLVAALNYLGEQGSIRLEVAGVRQAYRRLAAKVDVDALVDELDARFADREMRDVERLDAVIELADGDVCIARHLAGYFGEAMDEDCGHCTVCRGEHQALLPPTTQRRTQQIGKAVQEAVALNNPALTSPRQIARFLCGITSPATTRARVTREKAFGSLADVPFGDVLEAAEGVRRQS